MIASKPIPHGQIETYTTADIADSVDKRYQTDNQQLYNDATSSIQTQLNNRTITLAKKATDSSTLTGTTSETILESIEITSGKVLAGDLLWLKNRINRATGGGAFTIRYRINTTNTLVGASLLGTVSLPTGSYRGQGIERTLNFRTGNIIEIINNTLSIAYENAGPTSADIEVSFNFSSGFFIFITGQLGLSGDTMVNSNYSLLKF